MSSLKLENSTRKLQTWFELEFNEFIKELNKLVKKSGGQKLSKMDEIDWMEVFEVKKSEIQGLINAIDKTDKRINKLIYELYDLSEEEVRIIEKR